MSRPVAVVGVGQTKHAARRSDHSIMGLVREAVDRALADAGLEHKDIDAVVIGKAPDMLEGVAQPEQMLVGALGAHMKPMIRVHTAGSVGASTAITAATHVQSGLYDRVLTVAFEKQSESNAMWALAPKIPFQPTLVAGAGGYFAPHIREYIRRAGAPDHIGIEVAVKDRINALKNPYAHLRMPDISFEKVSESPMLWNPIRFLECCPSSDGACAMVLTNERNANSGSTKPAWIHGTAIRSEPLGMAGRDEVNPRAGRDCAADLYNQAGITDPRSQIDLAEIYVPFSWYEPMWLENLGFAPEGTGWQLTDKGVTALDGDLPINPSGGVLSSNPIGASGMLRFAEAAMQVRGQAGEHQVEGAKLALGHAYGGGSQFFAMWIVSDTKP